MGSIRELQSRACRIQPGFQGLRQSGQTACVGHTDTCSDVVREHPQETTVPPAACPADWWSGRYMGLLLRDLGLMQLMLLAVAAAAAVGCKCWEHSCSCFVGVSASFSTALKIALPPGYERHGMPLRIFIPHFAMSPI